MTKSEQNKWIGVAIIIGLIALVPVWRSGLKENMNFFGFVKNHTIWGDDPEYVPLEYATGGWRNDQNLLEGG